MVGLSLYSPGEQLLQFTNNVGTGLAGCGTQDRALMNNALAFALPAVNSILQAVFGSSFVSGGSFGVQNAFNQFQGNTLPSFFTPSFIPAPAQGLATSATPAAKGLTTNPEGWPANSIRTAGGYTVVPEGGTVWKIFGPDQNPSDTPMTTVHGDPHVDEADGTRWDFTKDSNFRLPDGTLIDVDTSSETGQSITMGLTVVNGADRIVVTGVNASPSLSAVTNDGFSYRAQLISQNPNRDTFVLGGGTGGSVQWAKETAGALQGVITGSTQDAQGSYLQTVDANAAFTIDASLRPDPLVNPGAWGNMLRSVLADTAGRTLDANSLTRGVAELQYTDALNQNATATQGNFASTYLWSSPMQTVQFAQGLMQMASVQLSMLSSLAGSTGGVFGGGMAVAPFGGTAGGGLGATAGSTTGIGAGNAAGNIADGFTAPNSTATGLNFWNGFQNNVGLGLAGLGAQDLSWLQNAISTSAPSINQILQSSLGSSLSVGGGFGFQNVFNQFAGSTSPWFFNPGFVNPPAQSLATSATPATKGVTTNPEGWPANSVRTAGGYTIVPEGDHAAWKIYGPDQSPTDEAMTRVWGDPHVNEADGTRWDFTKDSNFRLPDGTLIDVDTTSETGQSVTRAITIVNGADRVTVSGIDQNAPSLGTVLRDGFDYRAQLINTNPNRDTFVLGGGTRTSPVQWARERNGQIEGVITGATQDAQRTYDQVLDANQTFTIDASLRPDPLINPGAWGNMLRSVLADSAGRLLGAEGAAQAVAELQYTDALNKSSAPRFRDPITGRATGLELPPTASSRASFDPNSLVQFAEALFQRLRDQASMMFSLRGGIAMG